MRLTELSGIWVINSLTSPGRGQSLPWDQNCSVLAWATGKDLPSLPLYKQTCPDTLIPPGNRGCVPHREQSGVNFTPSSTPLTRPWPGCHADGDPIAAGGGPADGGRYACDGRSMDGVPSPLLHLRLCLPRATPPPCHPARPPVPSFRPGGAAAGAGPVPLCPCPPGAPAGRDGTLCPRGVRGDGGESAHR